MRFDKANIVMKGELDIQTLPNIHIEQFKWYPGDSPFATVKLVCDEGEATVPLLTFYQGKEGEYRDPDSYWQADELPNVPLGVTSIECTLEPAPGYQPTADEAQSELESHLQEIGEAWAGKQLEFVYENTLSSLNHPLSVEPRGAAEIALGQVLLNYPTFNLVFIDDDQEFYIKSVLRGDNIHNRYYVTDDENDEELDTPLRTEGEAISVAKQLGYKYVLKTWEIELFDGEVVLEDAQTVWVNPDAGEELAEGYGGAFDIDDDQYFTREDIDEFALHVLDHVDETFMDEYKIGGVWLEDRLLTLNLQSLDGMEEYEVTQHIDMRRVKLPKDLRKYELEMAGKLIDQIREYHKDV